MPVSDSRPCDDYDKPWEWAAAKQTQRYINDATVLQKPVSSAATQAPIVDSRNANDYDAPWEYSKRSSQLVSMTQGQAQKADGSTIPPKPPRAISDCDSTFNIDTSLPLEKQR
jgi:hypothetical protein